MNKEKLLKEFALKLNEKARSAKKKEDLLIVALAAQNLFKYRTDLVYFDRGNWIEVLDSHVERLIKQEGKLLNTLNFSDIKDELITSITQLGRFVYEQR